GQFGAAETTRQHERRRVAFGYPRSAGALLVISPGQDERLPGLREVPGKTAPILLRPELGRPTGTVHEDAIGLLRGLHRRRRRRDTELPLRRGQRVAERCGEQLAITLNGVQRARDGMVALVEARRDGLADAR